MDSAFLLAEALTVAADTADQREIPTLAETLYLRADWAWAQGDAAWAATYKWKHCYVLDYLYAGPLFIYQLSHIWVDFYGIQDAFMRGKGIDDFTNSRRATYVQQRYAIDNPLQFKGYGRDAWGTTASEGPGPAVRRIDGVERRCYDYAGRGAPHGLDDGTISPAAVVASLPFAPDIALPAIHHCVNTVQLHDCNWYGFKSSFNPTFPGQPGSASGGVSPNHFGLNLGPIVLLVIENHRSGLFRQLMRGYNWIVDGLRRTGFNGDWPSTSPPATDSRRRVKVYPCALTSN